MNESGAIVWLASYPKSGNTWLRILLNCLITNSAHESSLLDLNALQLTHHAGSRALVETVAACTTSELTNDEVDQLRVEGFRMLAARESSPIFIKAHDAYRLLAPGRPLFPENVTRQVIYLIRNPLDVAVSFAAHLSIKIDEVISLMIEDFSLSDHSSFVGPQVSQQLGSWSEHVQSWTSQTAMPVEVLRYEDMLTSTGESLERAANVAGLKVSDMDLNLAINAADFQRLQKMEMHSGFREKSKSHEGLFFRSGRVGEWRTVLRTQQIDRLIDAHESMMNKFGYLDGLQ